MTKAISTLAAKEKQTLEVELMRILEDIYNYFDSIIDSRLNDPVEQALKAVLKEYLMKATLEFEELQEELKKVKEKYANVDITKED